MRSAIAILLVAVAGDAADWGRFRGPNGSGVGDASTGVSPALGTVAQAAWKTPVPYGQSSPVVAGGRVYLTASEGDALLTLCFDAVTGKPLWRREARRKQRSESFRANDPASPSPAADAEGVYVFFQDLGLLAYSASGAERWRVELGPFRNFYGLASSPVLAGGLVVLACDQRKDSFLIAVDARTGRQRWRAERRTAGVGWGVPIVHERPGAPAEVVLLGSASVDGYDLATGERLWWLPVASEGGMGSPVIDGDTLIVSTKGHDEPWMPTFAAALAQYDRDKDGHIARAELAADPDWGEHFGWVDDSDDGFIVAAEWDRARMLGLGNYGVIAVRRGSARGALPDAVVRWRYKRSLPYIPSPLLYRGVYYMVRTGGIVTSLDPTTGAVLKQGRAGQAGGEYYASPVAADGKLFLLSEAGKLTVVRAAPQWEVLSVADLGEESHATPAIAGGRLFVRTREHLHCFAPRR